MAAKATLRAELRMDSRQYKAGMKGAEASTKRFQSGIASMGRTLGAAFTFTAVVGLTSKLISLGSSITDLAKQAGISTDVFQGLEHAAHKAGIAPELITKSFIKLNVVMGQAKSGMKTYLDLFDKVGISANELKNMGPEQVFERIAQTMATSKRGSVEYGASLELLGKAGGKMIEIMERINEIKLEGLTDEARRAGVVIDEEILQKLDKIADRWEIIKKQSATSGAGILSWAIDYHDFVQRILADTSALEKVWRTLLGPVGWAGPVGRSWGEGEGTQAEKSGRKPPTTEPEGLTKAEKAAVESAKKVNDAIARARLKGREKLKADLEAKEKEIAAKIAATSIEEEKQVLMDRAQMYRDHYKQDLQALIKSESEKLKAIEEASADRERGLRESSEERVANLVGRGTTVSSLARVGGFVGPQRGGLASADRQLQTLREHTRLLQAIEAGQAREAEAAERAASVASGDLGS